MPIKRHNGEAPDDDPEETAYTEEYDRQIDLGEDQANVRAADEEAAIFQEHRWDWDGDDYWADQRYADAYFSIHGEQPPG